MCHKAWLNCFHEKPKRRTYAPMSLLKLLQTQALTTHFQPIIDTYRSSLIGYESLIRGPIGHPLEHPDKLFAESEALELRDSLEYYCLKAAVNNFDSKRFSGSLFININPNLLLQPSCLAILDQLPNKTAASIVLELSEHYPIDDIQELKARMHRLRAVGFRFAIDDLGAGHSSFKLWAEVRPDYVKLDRYFISDIDNSPYKREFVQHIVTLAKSLHATVIAEGIETQDELRQLQKLGIYASQGFLIGRPGPAPIDIHSLTDRISYDDVTERYANPLTLLPGNVPINQTIDQHVQDGEPFAVLYFDLNYFKPFNDEYGYHRGDAVLQWFAKLQDLKKTFQEQVKSFYRAPHLAENGMVGRARNGRFRKFPLLDFCVAIVAIASGTSLSHQDIASIAAQMKGRAKKAKDGIAVHHTQQKLLSEPPKKSHHLKALNLKSCQRL